MLTFLLMYHCLRASMSKLIVLEVQAATESTSYNHTSLSLSVQRVSISVPNEESKNREDEEKCMTLPTTPNSHSEPYAKKINTNNKFLKS